MRIALIHLVAFGLFASCATGITPPEPTEMVEIRDGLTFTFGSDEPCSSDSLASDPFDPCEEGEGTLVPETDPAVEVALEPFAIDEHEVTNIQYEYCVEAGGCPELPAFNAVAAEQQEYYRIDEFDDYPVVQVTWEQARDYCAFVGKRLPTEFEWERAAKGNPDEGVQREWPAEGLDRPSDCQGTQFPSLFCRGDNKLDPVDVAPADFVTEGGQRIHHLFSNAAEWVSSWYSPDVNTCKEPLPDPACVSCAECGDNDTQCQQDCQTCTECQQEGGPLPCFIGCDGTTRDYPACVAYTAADQPLAPSELEATQDDSVRGKMIRGGSVTTTSARACEFRSSNRNVFWQVDRGQAYVGFRCARSL
ncbi:MAG: formylglycine-generating enzyme family protein [Myxococcota bacterium]